jgi:glycosyltransferase involved in cell wall biosynthesis
MGHSSEVVCLDSPDAPWIKNAPLPSHASGPAFSYYRYSPRFVPWIRNNAKRFDCVIVHGIWRFPTMGVRMALRNSSTPYFIYTHGMMDPTFRTLFPVRHMIKNTWWKLAEHRIVRDARAVFFTCEEEKRLAHQSFKPFECRDAIVPYCVGEPPGDPAVQKAAFLKAFPLLSDKRRILFLSRLHKKKGCDLLIHAFAHVSSMDPSLQLIMAGPDSMDWRADLEQESEALGIRDRITWTGMLTGDLKWGALHAAEVFVLPSHQENFGIAVVEALACRLPVLISDKINIWREIDSDGAAIVECATVKGTEKMLERWLRLDPASQEEMRRRARTCFNTRFRSDAAAKRLVSVLNALLLDECEGK